MRRRALWAYDDDADPAQVRRDEAAQIFDLCHEFGYGYIASKLVRAGGTYDDALRSLADLKRVDKAIEAAWDRTLAAMKKRRARLTGR